MPIKILNTSGQVRDVGQDGNISKVSVDDSTPNYLEEKFVAGSNITITTLFPGGDEALEIASSGSADTVSVSANDTTPGYLNGKLVAGSNITFTENNDGSNETLTIASSGGGISTIAAATDTNISTPADSQVLVYNNGTSDWENKHLISRFFLREENFIVLSGNSEHLTFNRGITGSIATFFGDTSSASNIPSDYLYFSATKYALINYYLFFSDGYGDPIMSSGDINVALHVDSPSSGTFSPPTYVFPLHQYYSLNGDADMVSGNFSWLFPSDSEFTFYVENNNGFDIGVTYHVTVEILDLPI